MKTKIKRHSRSVLSVILAISMLVSCMMVGIIATDAARVNSEKVGLDSGDGIHLGIGTTTTTWHGMGSNAYEFTLAATTTIYYTFSVGGSNYGKGNQGTPGADSEESWTWYAIKGNNTQYSTSLPAGTYKFKIKGYQGNNTNTLEYQFWAVSSGGGGDEPEPTNAKYYLYGDDLGGWSWTDNDAGWESSLTRMDYDSSTGYYYHRHTYSSGGNKYFRGGKRENSSSTHYGVTSDTSITIDGQKVTSNSGWDKAFYFNTDSIKDVVIYFDPTNKQFWVKTATDPIATSLSISANPTELTAVNQTSTITVTATDIASGVTNLTYTIYDRANNNPVGSPVTVTNGATSATFTVTPNARAKSYYASVKPTDSAQQALYDEVWTASDVTITNSADAYIPRYTVTFSSNNNSYGTVTAKDASGNAITSGAQVKEGDSITFTATAKTGNVFVNWSEFDTKSNAVTRVIRANTTATGNFGPKGYSIFYQSDATAAMTEKSNGWYVSPKLPNGYTFTIKQNFSGKYLNAGGDNDYYKWNTDWMGPDDWDGISDSEWESTKFTTPNSKFYKNETGNDVYCVYDPSTNRVWVTTDPDGLYEVHVVAKDGTIRYGYKTTADYTQVFGDTTVELVSPSSITGTVDNNAYDGMAVAYNLSANDVRNGVTLKIMTQTKQTYVDQGYYVKGFVVSGYEESFSVLWQEFDGGEKGAAEKASYDDRAWIHDGYNEFELTIDGYPEKNIEITPVYEIRENKYGDNIRFYVEGFAGEVYKQWGGTLAIDAYSTGVARKFGEYPGQPMINYNGRYVVDLPREGITGITLNNYVWDRIHSNLFYGTTGTGTDDTFNNTVKANNYQTYDFNDFIYLKQVMDAANHDEDIVFSFRHRTSDDHDTKATSQLSTSTYYENSTGSSATTENDYRKDFNTIDPNDSIYQWENLTDFYGNRVDIFGDIVDIKDSSGTVTNPKAAYTNPIRIVSNGYDYNKAGNYATAWALYEPVDANDQPAYTGTVHHYKLIEVFGGQGIVNTDYSQRYDSSSYLVNPRWTINLRDKYDDAYAHDTSKTHSGANYRFDLTRVPTVISYEYQVKDGYSNLNLENRNDGGEPAYRSDGRWFTTSSDQFLTAHTIIEYAEKDEESLYHRDFYQGNGIDYTSASGYNPAAHTGIATGIQAYFENSDSDDGTVTGTAYTNTSGNTEAYAVSDGEHEFLLKAVGDPDGEYMFKGWYMYTNGKYSLVSRSETYPSEATANDVYVARYYKVPSGTLNVTHNLHPDSTGTADCYAKVEVMNGNSVVYTYPETTDAIKVTSAHMKTNSNNTLKITLRTVTDSKTGFDSFKMKLSDTIEALAASGVIASVSAIDTSTPNEYKVIIQTNAISTFFDNEGSQTTKSLPFYSLLNEKNFAHTKILYSPAKYLSNGFDSDLTQNDADTVISALTRDYYQIGNVDWTSASGYDKTDITGNSTEARAYMTASGNNVTEVDFNANDTITLNAVDSPSQNSVRYSFVGWIVEKTAADGTKTTVKLSNSYTTAANTYTAAATDKELVFIAVFEPVLNYVIKYNYDSSHYGSQYYQVTGTFTAAEIATYLTWDDNKTSNDGLDGAYSYNISNKQEFFAAKSPYEKNVGKTFQWEFSNDTTAHYSANHQLSSTVPSHNGTDTTRKIQFEFPYRVKSTNSGTESEKTENKVYIVPDNESYKVGQFSRYLNIDSAAYGSPYTLNWEETNEGTTVTKSSYITAEEKIFDINEDEYHFAYWSLQNIPINVRTSSPNPGDPIINYDNQVEVARCYNLEFNFTIYQDYIVKPVYRKSTAMIPKVHSDSATITFVESGRNQWNANGGGTGVPETQKTQGDKIFLQFMTAYDREDMMLLNSQTNVEVGILYERLNELTAEQKEDVPSPINLFNYYGNIDSTHGNAAAKAAVATTTNTTVGKQQYAIMKLDSAQKLQKIDNKNRIALEQGVTHKNNQGQVTGYANYVYRAYAYMKEANGNVTISEQPVYFTFYTIANMADGSRQG